jgi:hypothetical protein
MLAIRRSMNKPTPTAAAFRLRKVPAPALGRPHRTSRDAPLESRRGRASQK